MKKILLNVLLLLLAVSVHSQTNPKRELRGVWVSTHLSLDWPNRNQTSAQQQTALVGILNHNKNTGMNAVYLQVRSQSDALYPSAFEPWSYYLTNQQGSAPVPFWDPLQFAITETRKRGMEFHAWINPYRAVATLANAGNNAQYAATHVSRTHPEWMLNIGTVQILNPGIPEVRDHVTNVIVDIVKRYDVDGIHFDDYFYPNGTSGDDAAYNADPRGFPATTAGRADWRRDNINLLIKRVSDSINVLKPWVKFGISPSGIYRSSTDPNIGSPTSAGALQHYSNLFADSKKWIQSGWVDYLTPQVYWYIGQTGSDYKLLVPWWNNNAFGRHIYIGMADYKVNTAGWMSRSEIPNQVRLNRANDHVYGQTHFRHAFLVSNPLNYRDSLRLHFYNTPAMLPLMHWKDSIAPGAPTALTLTSNHDQSNTLSWASPAATSDEFNKVRRFAIYRSGSPLIDTENVTNLIYITDTAQTTFTDTAAPADSIVFYAITALDRLHNESAKSNIAANDTIKPVVITRNISRTLQNGTVSISYSDIDSASSDNWGIASWSLSKTSFNCSEIGQHTVVLRVTDLAGNVDSASAIVDIQGTIPATAITLSRSDNTFTGLPANTIALGYGAQSLNLTASGTPGTSYQWTPATGLSGTTSQTVVFTPSQAGTYTFTVEASNSYACTATANVTINVIDSRCQNNKVLLYKKAGNQKCIELCVARPAVQALLNTGATLQSCEEPETEPVPGDELSGVGLSAYPNPFNSQLTLTFRLENSANVSLEVYSLTGKKVLQVYSGPADAGQFYSYPVDASKLDGKFFNARLVAGKKVYNFRLVRD